MEDRVEQILHERIEEELDPIDMEERYREMLDEIYPEVEVGYSTFLASRVLEELDPTAFRVGMSDYESGENFYELNGEYYWQHEVDDLRAEIEDELALEEEEEELSNEVEENNTEEV